MNSAKAYLATVIFLLVSVLVACSATENPAMTLEIQEHDATLTMKNAKKNDYISSAALTVDDEQEITVYPQLDDNGRVEIKFTAILGEQGISEKTDYKKPEIKVVFSWYDSGGWSAIKVPAGDYMVTATVLSKTTGEVRIMSIDMNPKGSPNEDRIPWFRVGSAEEAKENAGFDDFILPIDAIVDLGYGVKSHDNDSYFYRNNSVLAVFHTEKGNLCIFKASYSPSNDPDISGDQRDYILNWTQNINDIDVECYGNVEGNTRKALWHDKDNEFCYAVLITGEDESMGFSEGELSTLVAGIQ